MANLLKDYWVLTNVQGPVISHRTTGDFYIIEFTNADTNERRRTFADTSHKNFDNWRDCIDRKWGFYGNLKRKGEDLINGDCKPVFAEAMSEDDCKYFRLHGRIE